MAAGGTVEHCGTGTVAPVDVELPFASADFAERYEGMLVKMTQTLTVTEHFQLGRFGEVLMSSGGRLPQPTILGARCPGAGPAGRQQPQPDPVRRRVAGPEPRPDPVRSGRAAAVGEQHAQGRGHRDRNGRRPHLHLGRQRRQCRTPTGCVRSARSGGGVPTSSPSTPRPTAAPARSVGTTARVAGVNLLNFFNTFTGCTSGTTGGPMDCRGADNRRVRAAAAEDGRRHHRRPAPTSSASTRSRTTATARTARSSSSSTSSTRQPLRHLRAHRRRRAGPVRRTPPAATPSRSACSAAPRRSYSPAGADAPALDAAAPSGLPERRQRRRDPRRPDRAQPARHRAGRSRT